MKTPKDKWILTPRHRLPRGHTPRRPTKPMRDKRKRREKARVKRSVLDGLE